MGNEKTSEALHDEQDALKKTQNEGRAAHYAYCSNLVRTQDNTRWLACLFAPESLRPHLHALYAFNQEIACVRDLAREALLGEIRLQWWRETLEAKTEERAHPVADALLDTIAACHLPRQAFLDLIEARRFDLYDEPMPSLEALEEYCGYTCSSLFRLATLILSRKGTVGGAEAAGYAGVAYALAGLFVSAPLQEARIWRYIPRNILRHYAEQAGDETGGAIAPSPLQERFYARADLLAFARRRWSQALESLHEIPLEARAAFLPLAITPLYLTALEKSSPSEQPKNIAQWRRQWTLWRFSRKLKHL